MFDLLPGNARSADVAEARSTALVFGAVMLWAAFVTRPRGPSVRTLAGTVVGIQTRKAIDPPANNPDLYAPIVRFEADGREHEFTGRLFSTSSTWRVGQAVDVLYDPASGRTAIGGLAEWQPGVRLSLAGAVALTLGRVLWRRRRWRRQGLW
jgi:hypothetical protein